MRALATRRALSRVQSGSDELDKTRGCSATGCMLNMDGMVAAGQIEYPGTGRASTFNHKNNRAFRATQSSIHVFFDNLTSIYPNSNVNADGSGTKRARFKPTSLEAGFVA